MTGSFAYPRVCRPPSVVCSLFSLLRLPSIPSVKRTNASVGNAENYNRNIDRSVARDLIWGGGY